MHTCVYTHRWQVAHTVLRVQIFSTHTMHCACTPTQTLHSTTRYSPQSLHSCDTRCQTQAGPCWLHTALAAHTKSGPRADLTSRQPTEFTCFIQVFTLNT